LPHSPELAGGAGFTYEGDVAAFYMSSLLAEKFAPGINDRVVSCVSVQQRDFGEPLDDVIVDFQRAIGEPARLSLQVKRSLTISDAKSNTDFREVVRDSWSTLNKNNFRHGIDRYGAAVGTVAKSKAEAMNKLCEFARESQTTDHFELRFAPDGNASGEVKEVKDAIVALLDEANGNPCTKEQVHQFLAHFVLIQFDFLREGAGDPPEAMNRIRDCLVPDEADKAPLVWSRLIELARSSAGTAGQFDRARLVRSVSQIARLRGATSLLHDLDKLKALARSYAAGIQDDVGGTRLDRASLVEEIDNALSSSRLVQIRGLPGSGKSALLKRIVWRAIERGPVLFLKADQLEGRSWLAFATLQGLSGARLSDLLVEIAATGSSVLYIDAVDRVEKEHRPVVLDVLRTIIESPLLDNWRIIVSLRDNGIELVRNWMSELLEAVESRSVIVEPLNDDESEILAQSKPHLRALLFGADRVKEIVRRPFFAKVLDQGYVADANAPPPQSEVDLVESWWTRGGYNSSGQDAIGRQRAIIDLAAFRARHLSRPISFPELAQSTVTKIDELVTDGILQHAHAGHTVRFSHDIFFEWAFFHVLVDREEQWLKEIRDCGEPPAVARVVELLAQREYADGNDWSHVLAQIASSKMRSQWTRAWLLGPLATSEFERDEDQFASAVFANDFSLLKKALVWFQAEKTVPNPHVLAQSLKREQRLLFADFLGWPSDFAAWRRFISFLLRRISDIPVRLRPAVVAIFEVWQNALSGVRNAVTRAILTQCAEWLRDIQTPSSAEEPEARSTRWKQVADIGEFGKSLSQLILRASIAEPAFAEEYLKRVIAWERLREGTFEEIVAFSPVLAQSHPRLLVELTLKHLIEELPDDKVAREKAELEEAAERRKQILAKPESERTHSEKLALSEGFPFFGRDFSYHDWHELSINQVSRGFFPASPLREPFHSLFQSSPEEGLRLLRELCNHAITAWRQLHRHSHDSPGTPMALEIAFPWGLQKFWGCSREYLWFRGSVWGPKPIACGFLALEEWCFAELERGRPVDELIHEIVEGNDCIAILGVAVMIALHTQAVSEVTLVLVTSQRLWAADYNRLAQDLHADVTARIGFDRGEEGHFEAVQAANARQVRRTQLRWLVPLFVFGGEGFPERTRAAILDFKNNLPYAYEEERNDQAVREYLTKQALEYSELADPKNYRAYETDKETGQIAIVHVSPTASASEQVAKAEEAKLRLQEGNLWAWATKAFETGALGEGFTLTDAIAFAKQLDGETLFAPSAPEDEGIGMRRGAVASVAAVALNFRQGCREADLVWARAVLKRALHAAETRDPGWFYVAQIPWHHAIFAARGLAADLREGTADDDTGRALLGLVTHPLEIVSLTALGELCRLWAKDPKLAWSALGLAFSLCQLEPVAPDRPRGPNEGVHTEEKLRKALEAAEEFYRDSDDWRPLPAPPPAWVKLDDKNGRRRRYHGIGHDPDDAINPAEVWVEPDARWYSQYAAKILPLLPLDGILASGAKGPFLKFLWELLNWTIEKNAPPWVKPERRDRRSADLYDGTRSLGQTLGRVSGLLTLEEIRPRFLEPIFALQGDACWALLAPFTSAYVCCYVYDAVVVPADAVTILDLCLGRFLASPAFKRELYRSGHFYGFDEPRLIETLMFVSVEHAALAARYVNSDWSEINRILPLIDRLVRAGGWTASVMAPFLTLCERAKASYPADVFADQILTVVGDGSEQLKGWQNASIPARIAELVQHFADRDAPMPLHLAQKFLRILDLLVDMGDRRSAALQLGEAFREIRAAAN
jgi:hypothetical protein